MAKVAVILAGCGVYDGSEIHESTLLLYFLDELGADVSIFAPNKKQHHVINHSLGEANDDERNCLTEASRIARGNIANLDELAVEEFDTIILPGGFGATKNLCDYAITGQEMSVDKQIESIIKNAHSLGKPLGFLCISPVIAAKVIPGVTITLGNTSDTSKHAENWGAIHKECNAENIVWDEQNKVASTPAYMHDVSIKSIAKGIKQLCDVILSNA